MPGKGKSKAIRSHLVAAGGEDDVELHSYGGGKQPSVLAPSAGGGRGKRLIGAKARGTGGSSTEEQESRDSDDYTGERSLQGDMDLPSDHFDDGFSSESDGGTDADTDADTDGDSDTSDEEDTVANSADAQSRRLVCCPRTVAMLPSAVPPPSLLSLADGAATAGADDPQCRRHRLVPAVPVDASGSLRRYRRLRRLGEGTYGTVFLAKDLWTRKKVALKLIRQIAEHEGFPVTTMRELRLLRQLRHENVVTLRDVLTVPSHELDDELREMVRASTPDEWHGEPVTFLVFDYYDSDLGDLVDGMAAVSPSAHATRSFGEIPPPLDRRLSEGEVKCLMRQLLDGVAYMHKHFIVHRDLKLSNLLFRHGHVAIADFGLSRLFSFPLAQYTPRVVTLWYRAPELLLGEPRYHTAVDMWSVGCIMAEFLLGVPLMPGSTELEQLALIYRLVGRADARVWPQFAEYRFTGVAESPRCVLEQAQREFQQQQQQENDDGDYHGDGDRCDYSDLSDHPDNRARGGGGKSVQVLRILRHDDEDERAVGDRLDRVFAHCSSSCRDLLRQLLRFDPAQRITAEEALQHAYFDEEPRALAPAQFRSLARLLKRRDLRKKRRRKRRGEDERPPKRRRRQLEEEDQVQHEAEEYETEELGEQEWPQYYPPTEMYEHAPPVYAYEQHVPPPLPHTFEDMPPPIPSYQPQEYPYRLLYDTSSAVQDLAFDRVRQLQQQQQHEQQLRLPDLPLAHAPLAPMPPHEQQDQ
ncbi:MAG: hypothetical protein MHM6MM_001296 [Cercozoa sp. M6MM]